MIKSSVFIVSEITSKKRDTLDLFVPPPRWPRPYWGAFPGRWFCTPGPLAVLPMGLCEAYSVDKGLLVVQKAPGFFKSFPQKV